jgi:hypothetical protein
MTDERITELMEWVAGTSFEPGDLAYRVRALVATAERDERERCAKVCEDSDVFDCDDLGGFFAKLIRGHDA